MTTTASPTALCICRHIHTHHHRRHEGCAIRDCRCDRFQITSRKSRSHYQRGQVTIRKRVAQLQHGDRLLVGFPGHNEYERDTDGAYIWVQDEPGAATHPLVRHVDDVVLRPVEHKTDALVAGVVGVSWRHEDWTVITDLGELPVLGGHRFVHVLVER